MPWSQLHGAARQGDVSAYASLVASVIILYLWNDNSSSSYRPMLSFCFITCRGLVCSLLTSRITHALDSVSVELEDLEDGVALSSRSFMKLQFGVLEEASSLQF